jgi:hypothetical protein
VKIQTPWFLWILLGAASCVGDIGAGIGGGMAPPSGGGDTPATPPGQGVKPGSPPTPEQPPPGERPAPAAVSTTRFARLSHRQWENTVRDLLRLPAVPGLSVKFSSDTLGTFANDGETLSVADTLRVDYQAAAEALALRVARDPAALARLLPANAPAEPRARALAFIRDFGRRAYRRPLADQEVTDYTALFNQGGTLIPGIDAFAAGAQLVLEAMLQSHHFLYRTELTAAAGRVRLGDHEIAAKLSFALIGSMPDEPLFAAAAAGGLRDPAQIGKQVERLLSQGAEPASTFHEELYGLRSLDLEKDPGTFPEFRPAWQESIVKESALFLGDIFAGGHGLTDLLTSPFSYVDATLAPLYGVSTPSGFARVQLDPRTRAGLLTQIAFLARDGLSEPEPIRRGAFVNRTILCLDLVPPPGATDNVPLPPATARTNRERTNAITSAPTCAACHHAMINPAGFAFENYDALGRHRTLENGVPIDAAGTYNFASGPKSFKDAVEWSRVLAESPEAHECYARNWFTFLQGRAARPQDEPFIKWLAGRSLRERASLKAMAMTVVTDDSFLTRLP